MPRARSGEECLIDRLGQPVPAELQSEPNCEADEGGRRAAAVYTLIETAKLNDIDPHAWLADVLARLPDHPAKRLNEPLP